MSPACEGEMYVDGVKHTDVVDDVWEALTANGQCQGSVM